MVDRTGIDCLIEALIIVRGYMNEYQQSSPTNCTHDMLTINVDAYKISKSDLIRLEVLGFFIDEYESLASHRFGSC